MYAMTYKELCEINREYRNNDDSHLWPIRGKFNVTERAIKRVRKFRQYYGEISAYEYRTILDYEISEIVNSENNW